MAGVDDVNVEVGAERVVNGGAEGVDERVRYVANEADGVDKYDGLLVVAGAGEVRRAVKGDVERVKELIAGAHLLVAGEQLDEARLAHVCVAEDADGGYALVASTLAGEGARAHDVVELASDALLDALRRCR